MSVSVDWHWIAWMSRCLNTFIAWESPGSLSRLQYMSNLVRRTDNPWWCVFLSSSLIVCSVLYLWHYLKYLNCQKWLSHHFHKYLNYHNIVRSHKLWPFTVVLLFSKYWIWHRSLLDLCDTVLQFGQMCKTCHGDWICIDSVEGDLRKLLLCKPTNILPPLSAFSWLYMFSLQRIWMRGDEWGFGWEEKRERKVMQQQGKEGDAIPAKEWTLCVSQSAVCSRLATSNSPAAT